ncbi:MAG TPA: ABC transporter permease [Thermomicrobiales bacterium]|jgi:peptide/nickel transport system permease protein|nr:ABC transporter permease [Thermomicrobiales bacterium]
MGRYIQRRLIISVPILIAITAIIFGLLQLTPGDPLDAYLQPDQVLTADQRAALRHELGLDRPAPIRYLYWLRELARGDLGYRIKDGQPVARAIAQRLGPTLMLMGSGLVIAIAIGVTLGVLSAIRQYSILDFALTVFAFLGLSLPAFFAGLLGLYIFSLKLHWFPAGGFSTPGVPFSFWDRLHHLLLPAILLSLFNIGYFMRYTRAAMLEVLGQDYVRTAQAKGLAPRIVVGYHALRNALLPVATIIGASVPGLIGGAVFIESIFSWPGMGSLYLDGIDGRDYPLIMGLTFILAVVILLANLLTDLAYAVIDPRIRYG